jgi:hypothetical protein
MRLTKEYFSRKTVWISESRFTKTMTSTDTSNHRTPTPSGADNSQHGTWLAAVLPLLKYLNTRTLAFSLFIGFAFLNATHGKDAQTDKPAAGVTNTEPRDNGYQGASAVAPLILWQFTARIVHAFTAALNDPALIEYAKQQEKDIPDLQITPCQGAEGKTSTY